MANAPGIINIEISTNNQPISADDSSVAGFMGVSEWGPLATPTLVRSFKEYRDKFGGYMTTSDLAYAVETFFTAGGKKAYISRLAKYTDIADASTHPGVAASLSFTDRALPAGAATLTISSKYVGTYGNIIETKIVSNPLVEGYILLGSVSDGVDSILLAGKSNISVGQVLHIAEGNDARDLLSSIRLAEHIRTQYTAHCASTVAHTAADATNAVTAPTATNLATLIVLLNDIRTQYEAHRILTAGSVHGAADTVNIITQAAASDLPSCILLVNDIKAAYNAHCATAGPVHAAADVVNSLKSEAYGKVLTISTQFSGGIPIHTITFAAALAITGTTPARAINLEFGEVTSTEFDVEVYYDGNATAVETFEQLSIESDVDNYALTVINDTATGSIYIAATDPNASSLGNGFDTPAATSKVALTGGVSELGVGLGITDLVGNSSSALGFNAFDSREDVRILMAIPDTSSQSYASEVITSALTYCSTRKDMFFIAEADPALTAEQAIAARKSSGFNSSFGALYTGRIEILDNKSGAATPTKFVSPLGYIAGKYALVDNLPAPDGGTWNAAAGYSPYGNLPNAISVEKAYSVADRALLNEAGINIIRDRASQGILIYGVRTLSEELPFRYINVRRLFLFVQQSVANSVEGTLFRNNNASTWNSLKVTLTTFLGDMFRQGAFKGDTPAQAFFVKVGEKDGVQTTDDTDNGRLVTEIGIAAQKPAEFLIFRYSQFDGGSDIS